MARGHAPRRCCSFDMYGDQGSVCVISRLHARCHNLSEGEGLRNTGDEDGCSRRICSSLLLTYWARILKWASLLTGKRFRMHAAQIVGLLALVFAAVGCGTATVHVEHISAMPECQCEFLQFERSSYRGDDKISDARVDDFDEYRACFDFTHAECFERHAEAVHEAETAFAGFDSDRVHDAELVGHLRLSIPEPELIEDPLLHEYCIESARSWCAPDVEDIYLSYIAEELRQKHQAAIFPNFVSPIEGGLVLRGMQRPQKGRRGHYGLDVIPVAPDRCGVPIRSVEDGVVVVAGRASGYGYYTVVYHQNGLFSLYSHLLKQSPVAVGQTVERGEQVGQMGKSGNARGYHLHFELIDLREAWDSAHGIDWFVQALPEGQVATSEMNQFYKLLFNKSTKVNPLPGIPGLMAAKKVNGKWTAVPLEEAGLVAASDK